MTKPKPQDAGTRIAGDRRRVERREGKRGVNVRHDDQYPNDAKRVKRGRFARKVSE